MRRRSKQLWQRLLRALGLGGAGRTAHAGAPAAAAAQGTSTGGRPPVALIGGLGLLLLALNAGVYLAVASGTVPLPRSLTAQEGTPLAQPRKTFRRKIDKMVVDLGPTADAKYLRTSFVVELEAPDKASVAAAMPRFKTALQRYLRVLDERDLEERAAVRRLRRHGRRRLAVASPDDVELRHVYVTDLVLK